VNLFYRASRRQWKKCLPTYPEELRLAVGVGDPAASAPGDDEEDDDLLPSIAESNLRMLAISCWSLGKRVLRKTNDLF